MRNNILINKSVANGTGSAIAFIRNSTSTVSYSTNSDRNCFYAGVPAANRLIFFDYTNSIQTLAAYKTYMGGVKDANSVTENVSFVNTAVTPYDLHLALCTSTQLESSGGVVSTPIAITTDYDGNNRYPNAGFPACSTWAAVAPDIGADEFGGIYVDIAPPAISYTALGNTSNTSTRTLDNVTITDPTGVNVSPGTKPRVYYKKSTDNNNIVDNTVFTDGWKYAEANGTTSPFDFTITYSNIFGGSVTTGDVIQYFVVAQDLASTPNVGINSGTFNTTPTSVALIAANTPITGTINSYLISASFSGTYTVGTLGGENFPSLTGAGGLFAALNAGVMAGNITAQITSDLSEDGANDLNPLSYDVPGANYTLRIVPASATEKVISGSVANGMIRFDGNDYVTIDGNNGLDGSVTKYLRFRNTNGANPTISFFNESRRNVITNCIIESNNTSALTTSAGTILFGTTTGTLGNDSNTISNCDIRDRSDAAGFPVYSIATSGTTTSAAHGNSDIIITNNNIYNFYGNGQFCSGIFFNTGANTWTVSGNSFYQTDPRTNTLASGYNCIFTAAADIQGLTITGNYFGGSAPLCGGAPWTTNTVTPGSTNFVYAIRFGAAGVTNMSTISNNVIQNIDITIDTHPTAGSLWFDGILIQAGAVDISNNTIGSQSSTGNIVVRVNNGILGWAFFGIDMRGAIGSVTNNTVGGFSALGTNTGACIMVGVNEGTVTSTSAIHVTGNTIGGTVANSMQDIRGGVAFGQFTGIRSSQGGAALTTNISSNTIRNMTDNGSGAGFMAGISHSGTTRAQIDNNTITTLNSGISLTGAFSGLHSMCGISLTGTAISQSISGNTISNINNTYTGLNNTSVFGLQITSSTAVVTESRNKVYGITNQSTGTGPVIAGLNHYWGTTSTSSNNMVTITNGEATDNSTPKLKSESSKDYGNDKLITPGQNNNDNIKNIVPPTKQNTPPVEQKKVRTGEGSGTSGDDKKGSEIKNGQFNGDFGAVTVNEEPVYDEPVKPEANQPDAFTNGLIIYGIYDDATTPWTYYYNSVYVGGTASSGALSSYTFRKTSPTHVMRNNLFVNARTGGTGKHYCVYSTSTTAGSLNSNYNVYLGSNAATIGLWGVTDQTIAQWRTSLGSGRDQQTWSTTTGSLNPSNLFISISGGDLSINKGNTEAWLVTGKGIAIAGQNIDYNGDSRVTTIAAGTTDIGADECLTPSVDPPVAVESAPPSSGATTTYTLWGRTIASIAWGTGGSSYPSAISVKYWSGVNPPNTLGGNYANSYSDIIATGSLTDATYDITYFFGDNETGTISTPGTNTILAKYNASWEVFPLGINPWQTQLTYNTGTAVYTALVTGLYDFSSFALSDGTSPLPVVISEFNVTAVSRDANLTWITTHELNNRGFAVEKRIKLTGEKDVYSAWKEVAFVNGNGTTNEPRVYNYSDKKLNSGIYQYRLRQVDFNGHSEYFTPGQTDIAIGKPGSFDLSQNYPNPSNPKSKIDFQMPFDGKVSIKVYDILGKEVKTLIDEFKSADFYTVEFDGSGVASGTYFYRIIAEGNNQKFTKTLKMILVK